MFICTYYYVIKCFIIPQYLWASVSSSEQCDVYALSWWRRTGVESKGGSWNTYISWCVKDVTRWWTEAGQVYRFTETWYLRTMRCQVWDVRVWVQCGSSKLPACYTVPTNRLYVHSKNQSPSRSIRAPQHSIADDTSHASLVPRLLIFINPSHASLRSSGLIRRQIGVKHTDWQTHTHTACRVNDTRLR